MVDDACTDTLVKYCKSKNIVFKVYPTCFKNGEPVANPTAIRRKKIPRKLNDNVISDHETSTSCSEGSDDEAYIKAIKSGSNLDKNKSKGSIPPSIPPSVPSSVPLSLPPIPIAAPPTFTPISTPTVTQIPETPSTPGQAQI
uniref:Uncharacterized protein n=1 Tax=Tetranychus urticae TaxID=32264 RepID=T1K659_TETUR